MWGWGRCETVCNGGTFCLPLALILQHRHVTPIRDTLKLAGTRLPCRLVDHKYPDLFTLTSWRRCGAAMGGSAEDLSKLGGGSASSPLCTHLLRGLQEVR